MAGMDENLIKAITEQVIKAMQQGRELPAAINPPAGTCDGTFKPESSSSQTVAESLRDADASKTTDIPLTGIITANQLEQAVKDKGYALVAQDARLTPLANDFARQHKDKIRRANPVAGTASTNPTRVANNRWYWWIDGTCPVVKKVTAERQAVLTPMANPRKSEAVLSVVRDLASAVKSGHVSGGVLFVPIAAKAACYVNRTQSLRGVVGTSIKAVEEAVSEIGANVLIVEYLQHGSASVNAMLDVFLAAKPDVNTLIQRALAECHRLS
ncbi:MAG: hypothetical protein CMJ19_11495 [Phycisphaeraceae bacterium]|nr:hypothetical protein [Phycisphaeraceae bacterium]